MARSARPTLARMPIRAMWLLALDEDHKKTYDGLANGAKNTDEIATRTSRRWSSSSPRTSSPSPKGTSAEEDDLKIFAAIANLDDRDEAFLREAKSPMTRLKLAQSSDMGTTLTDVSTEGGKDKFSYGATGTVIRKKGGKAWDASATEIKARSTNALEYTKVLADDGKVEKGVPAGETEAQVRENAKNPKALRELLLKLTKEERAQLWTVYDKNQYLGDDAPLDQETKLTLKFMIKELEESRD